MHSGVGSNCAFHGWLRQKQAASGAGLKGEKFAGQQGPCPKCKALITIPKPEEEVVIHAPAQSEAGAVSAGGIPPLKTSRKKDAKFRPIVFAVVLGVVLVIVLLAALLRGAIFENWLVPTIATVLLGPPCAWAGYIFLRDAELEPYRGVELWISGAAS